MLLKITSRIYLSRKILFTVCACLVTCYSYTNFEKLMEFQFDINLLPLVAGFFPVRQCQPVCCKFVQSNVSLWKHVFRVSNVQFVSVHLQVLWSRSCRFQICKKQYIVVFVQTVQRRFESPYSVVNTVIRFGLA